MKSISKRFKAAQATVEPRAYAPLEAVSLVKANATAKFMPGMSDCSSFGHKRSCFADPRVTALFQDAIAWVEEHFWDKELFA